MMLSISTRITYSYLAILCHEPPGNPVGEDEGGVGERGSGALAVDGGGLH